MKVPDAWAASGRRWDGTCRSRIYPVGEDPLGSRSASYSCNHFCVSNFTVKITSTNSYIINVIDSVATPKTKLSHPYCSSRLLSRCALSKYTEQVELCDHEDILRMLVHLSETLLLLGIGDVCRGLTTCLACHHRPHS